MAFNYSETLFYEGARGMSTVNVNAKNTDVTIFGTFRTQALDCVEAINKYDSVLYARKDCCITEVPGNGHFNDEFADVSLILRYVGRNIGIAKKIALTILQVNCIDTEAFSIAITEALSHYLNGLTASDFFIENATFNYLEV